jgi:hypothetical protein
MNIQDVRSLIMQLSKYLDALAYREYVIRESDFGKRKHSAGNWGYLKSFMASYAIENDPEDVICLLEKASIPNDLEAARFLLRYDKEVP